MNHPPGAVSDTSLRDQVRDALGALLHHPLTAETDERSLADLVPDRYDSLGVLDAVGVIEQRLDVSIDLVEDDLRSTFYSVATIAALVGRKQRDAAVLGGMP